jgi:hypothetical protein
MTIQGEHDELEAKFLEERAALEAKYQILYQPLYTKVYQGFFNWLYRENSISDMMLFNEPDITLLVPLSNIIMFNCCITII